MGRQTAVDVVAACGTAVAIGQDPRRVDQTVKTLSRDRETYGISADGQGRIARLTRNLAIELTPHKIRVNAVAPAILATPIYERFVPRDQLELALSGSSTVALWLGTTRRAAKPTCDITYK